MRRRERTPNLIGRESALSALGEALEGVADAGSLVLVRGEVGIGKTRLLEEFAARVADEAHVLRGGCVEGVSYAPWTEALRRLLSTADVVAADDLPRRVRSQIARLLPHLSLDEADAAGVDESGGQHLLFEAIVELLARVAEEQAPGKVVVDLARLTFLDSSGIRCFIHAAKCASRVGSKLAGVVFVRSFGISSSV